MVVPESAAGRRAGGHGARGASGKATVVYIWFIYPIRLSFLLDSDCMILIPPPFCAVLIRLCFRVSSFSVFGLSSLIPSYLAYAVLHSTAPTALDTCLFVSSSLGQLGMGSTVYLV